MDLKILRIIILICSLLVYFGIIFTIPLRRKAILKRAGNLIFLVKCKSIIVQILIIVCCGLILAILAYRELGLVGDIVVCLVSILGVAMGASELSLYKNCGIYENGIIGNGFYLPYSEIYSIPVLSQDNSDLKDNSSTLLKVITDKKGTVSFSYDNPEEFKQVVEKLSEIKPAFSKKD